MATQQKNPNSFQSLGKRVQYGMDHGGGMGAIMGFMDLPYMSRQNGRQSMQIMWPGGVDPRTKNAGGSGDPTTGGDGPSYDPNNPDTPMLKAGLPPWYIDWLHTSGQYGVWNKPPGGGLLD